MLSLLLFILAQLAPVVVVDVYDMTGTWEVKTQAKGLSTCGAQDATDKAVYQWVLTDREPVDTLRAVTIEVTTETAFKSLVGSRDTGTHRLFVVGRCSKPCIASSFFEVTVDPKANTFVGRRVVSNTDKAGIACMTEMTATGRRL